MRRNFTAISLYTFLFLLSSSPRPIQGLSQTLSNDGVRRSLLSFKETIGNSSFQCSLSGPCLACQYSEKNDEKYRCSETGYRVTLKCIEIGDVSKEANSNKYQKRRSAMEDDTKFSSYANPKLSTALVNARKLALSARNFRWRRLLDASFAVEGGKKTYITYRSCIPPVNEEKLGVLGFEGIMVCLLLISGTFIYFRRKRTAAMPGSGAVRIQTNSRF
ncbi:hypothetical protein MRB53_009254 [Persea americana]|uniref:Uncharacterized protein n=1 Tax=Persea americana TaxID=3435 RepID=A0ACC2LNM0_PERAE|nr:hypothetical protein MRB53_009254 [Persea americana]